MDSPASAAKCTSVSVNPDPTGAPSPRQRKAFRPDSAWRWSPPISRLRPPTRRWHRRCSGCRVPPLQWRWPPRGCSRWWGWTRAPHFTRRCATSALASLRACGWAAAWCRTRSPRPAPSRCSTTDSWCTASLPPGSCPAWTSCCTCWAPPCTSSNAPNDRPFARAAVERH